MAERENTPNNRLLVMDAVAILTTASAYSDTFLLKQCEYFSLEWKNSAAVQFDALLEMQCTDGTWITATTGSALVTDGTTAQGFVDLNPPFSTNRFRVKITNDNASTRTFSLYIHRSGNRI